MAVPVERIGNLGIFNFNLALHLTRRSLEYAERLLRLNMETALDLVDENKQSVERLRDRPEATLAEWPAVYQNSVDRVLDINRRYFAELAQAQKEITQRFGEEVTSFNEAMRGSIEDLKREALTATEESGRVLERMREESTRTILLAAEEGARATGELAGAGKQAGDEVMRAAGAKRGKA